MNDPIDHEIKSIKEAGMEKTLKQIHDEALEVASGWDGSSTQYVVGGFVYDEDSAHCAQEIVEKCEELKTLLAEFSEYGKSF